MKTSLAITVGVALAVLGGVAQAEVFKDKSYVTSCLPISNEEIMKRPDGSSIRKVVSNCIATGDLPFPFDVRKMVCIGTSEIGADGKFISSHGYCDSLSTKGDRVASWTAFNPTDQGTWGFFSGTGAYAGIKGGGTYKVKTPLPGGGGINQVTGSWETSAGTASK